MEHGDALNDMPEEYREYVEKVRAGDPAALQYIYDCAAGNKAAEGQSEADKAIADGKPRWMLHTDLGWKYIRFRERVQIKDDVCLRYNYASGSDFAAYDMTEACVLEILPYGETPPAVPEKPIGKATDVKVVGDTVTFRCITKPKPEQPESRGYSETSQGRSSYSVPPYKPDGLPSLNRCPDCDNTLEQRSMPDGIEEWCAECNMKVGVERKRFTGTTRITGDSFRRKTWEISTEAEGPMHPGMIRAELQKAMKEGYPVDIYWKQEYRADGSGGSSTGLYGVVSEFNIDTDIIKLASQCVPIYMIESVERIKPGE